MDNNWELNHVGLMIKDKDKTLSYFQSLGIGVSVGPQPLLPHIEGQGSLLIYTKLYGDPITLTYPTGGSHNFFDGESQIGSCQLECYSMTPGPGTFISEYLEKKGEGINHVCFNVPDVEGTTQKLLDKGCDLIFRAAVNDGTVENFIDTRKFGDVIVSLRPPASDWEKAWRANNMAHPLVSDWKYRGVGVAVEDLEKTLEYYQSLGFAARSEIEADATSKTKSALVGVGPLLYEFVQPVEGNSVYRESLDQRGEGVNNIAFTVDDLERETARLTEKGAPILLSGKQTTGTAFAYFDTRKKGNMMVKLIQAQ